MSGTWLPNPIRRPNLSMPRRMDQQDTQGTLGHCPPLSSQGRPTESFHHRQLVTRAEQPASSFSRAQEVYDDGLDDFDRSVLGETELPSEHVDDDDQYHLALSHLSRHLVPHQSEHQGYFNLPGTLAPFPEQRVSDRDHYAIDEFRPSPRTLGIIHREPAHRLRDLQGSRQQESPPFNQVLYGQTPPSDGSSATNYAGAGSSSPSTRVSLRKQQNLSTHAKVGSSLSMESSPPPLPVPSTQVDSRFGTPVVQGIPLISLRQALPDRFRAIFPFELFNAVQSKCFDTVYGSTDNIVVAAPTGSGKTAIFELAICKLALDHGNENFKIVYQAPTKALCSERARDWENKFRHVGSGLKCAELTGDTSQAEMRRVGEASIIVTTPEKWDSVTRKWQDHKRLLQMVELFLIDEVHFLKDLRGATLEAVVSRMKTIGANVRFIALSATVPNSDDIARWLGRNHTNQQLPAFRETFGEEFRPVKLDKFVYGYDCNGNDFVFDKFLDNKLPEVLVKHSHQKPILVFCFTRKSCENTAAELAKFVSVNTNKELWPMPSKRIPVLNPALQEIVQYGVGFHHAGLDAQDRNALETHFLKGELGVICCTSTLAVGVNLPCHTAVLKGTAGYSDDKIMEYSDLEVMQMLGRAGRPQFDKSATGIILTRKGHKARYEKMVSGQGILESTLHLSLIEHLNSEVCLGTINDLSSAKTWLAGTFLSVRLRRNPDHYQLTNNMSNPTQIDDRLEEICERDIKLLQEAEVVTDGDKFKCTDYGRAMSRYMVSFTTMKTLLQIPRAVGMEALITILSQASEVREFRFRPAERTLFRDLNKSPLLVYPIKEQVTQTHHKVSLVVQAQLGQIQYTDSEEGAKLRRQLLLEKKLIFERLQRLVRAVIDCKGYDRDAIGIQTALELARALSAESWEGRPTQLTQIPQVGPVAMRKLASKGVRTVLDLAEKSPDEIERLLSRQTPFGKKMKEVLERFPRLAFDMVSTGHKLQPRSKEEPVVINVSATARCLNEKGSPKWLGKSHIALTFLAESGDGNLVYFWRGNINKLDKQSGTELKFSVGLLDGSTPVVCHLTCEGIVGTMTSKFLKYSVPASAFPPKMSIGPQSLPALKQHGLSPPAKRSRSPPRSLAFSHATQHKHGEGQAYIDDELDDSDLIHAADLAMAHQSLTQSADPDPVSDSDEYPPVEDLRRAPTPDRVREQREFDRKLDAEFGDKEEDSLDGDQEVYREPVQLPNGKWQCNHPCSGDARTKSGKPCTHRCCKEGLDKPRKRTHPKPRKRKGDQPVDSDTIEVVPAHARYPSSSQPTNHPVGPQAKRPKLGSVISVEAKSSGSLGVMTSNTPWKTDLDVRNIDFIDLSTADDGLSQHSEASRAQGHKANSAMFKSIKTATNQRLPGVTNTTGNGLLSPISSARPHQNLPAEAAPSNSQPKSYFYDLADVAFMNEYTRLEQDRLAARFRGKATDMLTTQPREEAINRFFAQSREKAANKLKLPPAQFREGATDEVLYQSEGCDVFFETVCPASPMSVKRAKEQSLISYDPKFSSLSGDITMMDQPLASSFVPSPQSADSPTTESPDSSVPAGHANDDTAETAKATGLEDDPDWVSGEEFDRDFLDLFRGVVKFV
ncbi:putative HFM1/MER3 protein [Lasiosphaeria hispida]|uniref:DNA 3'-5' helicase n=1 Tax=Lasiosphaeria hispida TaxID=260671 RepID=A0AAJ0MC20_9PEZI|nr:putative HFM1/MER3 protein [Lasiosphaeria hispida]